MALRNFSPPPLILEIMKGIEEHTPLNSAMKTISNVIKSNAEIIRILDNLSSKKETPNIPPSEMALYHLDKARAEILKMQANKPV